MIHVLRIVIFSLPLTFLNACTGEAVDDFYQLFTPENVSAPEQVEPEASVEEADSQINWFLHEAKR